MYNDFNTYGDAGDSDDQPNSSKSSNSAVAACYEAESSNSRQNIVSSYPTPLDYDSMTDVVIDDVAENETTSAILSFCKKKFLRPYVHLLGFVGLRPMTSDTTSIQTCFTHFQTVFIFVLLCVGYFLQYFSSFRRDRGFSVNINDYYPDGYLNASKKNFYKEAYDVGQIICVYIIPSLLHVCGFFAAIYVFRIADNESLQNLVERVFLMSTAPRRLCVALWLYVGVGLLWLIFLFAYILLLSNAQSNHFEIDWFGNPSSTAQLCAKEKLLQHTIGTLDWMREVLEFRKLLTHLNRRVATPICFFTILNLSYAFAGMVFLFKEYDFNSPIKIFSLTIANLLMWLIVGLIPFFQAASVTRACRSIQAAGHQIRVRPFFYHNTTSEDLDSTLMFTSSLNMSAKLYRMPIQSNYLHFSILIISICILTLGMCLNVSLGIV